VTIRPRVLSALRRAATVRRDADLVAVSIPIAVDAAELVTRDEAAFVWDARRVESLAPEVIVGFGEAAVVDAEGPDRISRVRAAASELWPRVVAVGDAEPRMLGAIAFDPAMGPFAMFGQARFVLPRLTVRSGRSGSSIVAVVDRSEVASPGHVADEIEAFLEALPAPAPRGTARVVADGRSAFESAVERAVRAIEGGAVGKVVLARAVGVETNATASAVLSELAEAAGCVRYCIRRGGAAFVGATPELLLKLQGTEVRTEAVAGTEPRAGQELAETARLLSRTKDLEEHRWVADTIAETLIGLGCEVQRDIARVRTLAFVHHLVTPFVARAAAGTHILDLAAALHPTPALGGSPRTRALELIRAEETTARGLYAGPLGWFGPRGDGELVVALRGAVMQGGHAVAYAGAGIVQGSVPELEVRETDAKLWTMLRALGVAMPRRAAPQRFREADA
jgi:menaquinone-specific isochorismate synthase